MKTIIGIDPGPVESAYVIWDGETILDFGKVENGELLSRLNLGSGHCNILVIEKVACYGMAVGESVFETVFWSGRFAQAWLRDKRENEFSRIPRSDVKMHLCGSMRAKDGNIIQALKDRFEPGLQPRQRPKGILKGITKDCWQALAVCVTFWDNNNGHEAHRKE